MKLEVISLRTFFGAKDFDLSRAFYKDLGFDENVISESMSRFYTGELSFYLQRAYVKDWIENTMLVIEVPDVKQCFIYLQQLSLDKKYPSVKLIPIKKNDWGDECFMLDPSGVLLHFAEFNK